MNQKRNNSSAYEWENLYRSPVLLFYIIYKQKIFWHFLLQTVTDQSQKHAKQSIVALSAQI